MTEELRFLIYFIALAGMQRASFGCGEDSLRVACYASAELGCFLALGWPLPVQVMDLFADFRCLTNGLPTPCGSGRLGALAWFGLDGMGAADKEAMGDLVQRGLPFTAEERQAMIDATTKAGTVFRKLAGRAFDFHALRHQFISNMAAADIHPKVAQRLPRHSTISLTMDRYTHLAVADVAGALDRQPEPTSPKQASDARATGTEGSPGERPNSGRIRVVPRVVPTDGNSGVLESSGGHEAGCGPRHQENTKPLGIKGFESGGHGTRTRNPITGAPHFQCGR